MTGSEGARRPSFRRCSSRRRHRGKPPAAAKGRNPGDRGAVRIPSCRRCTKRLHHPGMPPGNPTRHTCSTGRGARGRTSLHPSTSPHHHRGRLPAWSTRSPCRLPRCPRMWSRIEPPPLPPQAMMKRGRERPAAILAREIMEFTLVQREVRRCRLNAAMCTLRTTSEGESSY